MPTREIVHAVTVSDIEIVIVTLPRKLKTAIDVIVGITILGEDMTSTDGMDRQRMNVLVGSLGQRRDKDARSIKLMTTELSHQTTAGTVPQSPANHLFDR